MRTVLFLIAATLASVLAVNFLSLIMFLVSSLLFGGGAPIYWNQIIFYLFWITIVATVIVTVVGIPIFFILNRYSKATISKLALVGAAIPSAIFVVINILYKPSGSYTSGSRQLIVDGERTYWGWVNLLEIAAFLSVYGIVAAIVFGFTIHRLISKYKNV